ncbi:uncharacterized protein LOC123529520 [Mercenaria mercenaria]|uniref:uncharacterized protein LOC123529520 n=1 Tax=Mercenaria mercenaria TaxID=6596 RepID=UPI00234F112D|nr:uncharacterized protein LOC123529520 [Mercenaria mercenaria]
MNTKVCFLSLFLCSYITNIKAFGSYTSSSSPTTSTSISPPGKNTTEASPETSSAPGKNTTEASPETTSPPGKNTTEASPETTSPPEKNTIEAPTEQCGCLDVTKLDNDIEHIYNKLAEILEQGTNVKEIPNISVKIEKIVSGIRNKTCQCSDRIHLGEMAEETHSKIDAVLAILNVSRNCECDDGNKLEKHNADILAKLDELVTMADAINSGIENSRKDNSDIKAKLEFIVEGDASNDNCNISHIEEDNDQIKLTLDEILGYLSTDDVKECNCEGQLRILYNRISEKLDDILVKINETDRQDRAGRNGSVRLNLDEINYKLDLIIEHDITGGKKDSECVNMNDLEGVVSQYCNDGGRNRKRNKGRRKGKDPEQEDKKKRKGTEERRQPWEIPKKDVDDLLFAYKGCIEKAMKDLHEWFEDKKWGRMPPEVQKIMITLYCKIGFKELKTLRKMKALLERGNWISAAQELEKWYRAKKLYHDDAAKKLIEKLKAFKGKMAPKE